MTVAETRARFGWADGDQVVLHAGNIGLKQGLEQVVDAARLAAGRGDPVRFVLSGGGNQAGAIRAAATPVGRVRRAASGSAILRRMRPGTLMRSGTGSGSPLSAADGLIAPGPGARHAH